MKWNRGSQHAAEHDEQVDRDVVVDDNAHETRGDADRRVNRETGARIVQGEQLQRQEFGGLHWGASFFGWLVAVGVAIILAGIVGAIATGIGNVQDVTQSDLERESGRIGIGAAIALVVILLISYYAGGYVAGRMSRFDGARQGFGVWVVGLVLMVLAAVVGAIFGTQYNVLSRVDIPDIPIPSDDLTWGGAITIVAALLVMLLGAVVGGKAGTHYHRKIDRTW